MLPKSVTSGFDQDGAAGGSKRVPTVPTVLNRHTRYSILRGIKAQNLRDNVAGTASGEAPGL